MAYASNPSARWVEAGGSIYRKALFQESKACVWWGAGNIAEWLKYVIPGNELDMVVAKANTSLSVKGRGICISVKVTGDNLVLSIAQAAFRRPSDIYFTSYLMSLDLATFSRSGGSDSRQ